ncbi:hypothetical protein K439DRAFT_1565630 [Ramaria rubella]|nr:hypothetical protein K439DRAFT_1565630 [Ramaria rubella]
MSRSSRELYYSSSSSRSRGRSQSANLPPIRDVVGDVLQQPARPYSDGYDTRNSMDRSYTLSPQPQTPPRGHQSATGLQLPPIHSPRSSNAAIQSTYPSYSPPAPANYYSSSTRPTRPPSQAAIRQEFPSQRNSSPAHSYDVFVSTSSDGLIHKRSSNKDDFHHVPKEDAIASSTGKHVCPECGRRFEKLSTLKNHLTTHSGEKHLGVIRVTQRDHNSPDLNIPGSSSPDLDNYIWCLDYHTTYN